MNKRTMKKGLAIVLALVMVFAMTATAFAETTSWTSFQGNDQNNGVITGKFSTEPTWDAVKLLGVGETTGWSGVDCQPLMTTEGGKTYAYVVTDSKEGPKAFKVNCEEKKIEEGWECGVSLADIPTAQLGTGTIVNDTWYLPVTYDYQILPNAYMSYDGGWSISAQNLEWDYDTTNFTGLHFNTRKPYGDIVQMISNSQETTIDVNVEDIWADFTIQFGSDTSAQMTNMNAKMYIKAQTESEWLLLGELTESQIPIGKPKELSVNCTRQLQKAGMGGDKCYQLKLEFSFDGATDNEVIVTKAEVYKNNMFVKKIANLSATKKPTAETMIDFHTYSETIDGGRSGQLNTPMLYINGNLFFGNWTRPDANGNNYAKYFKLNTSNNQLTTLNTGHTDDGFYLAGATVHNAGRQTYIIFGSDNSHLYMFNANTNSLVSEVSSGIAGQIRSSVSYADGGYFFTSKPGYVYKYVLVGTTLTKAWECQLQGACNATPTIYNGMAYVSLGQFGDTSGKFIGCNIDTGEWDFGDYTPGGPVQSSMLIYDKGNEELYTYYTVNKADGKGYCKKLGQRYAPVEIGENGYTLQGFAATNGYVVYGNDGVNVGDYKHVIKLYIAK